MSTRWFVSINGKKFGPYSDAKVKLMAQRGTLTPEDFMWKMGMLDWQRGTFFPDFFANCPPGKTSVRNGVEGPPEWYFNNEGNKEGPITLRQLQQLALRGVITRESFLYKNGCIKGWRPAHQVEEVDLKLISKTYSHHSGESAENGKKSGSILGFLGINRRANAS